MTDRSRLINRVRKLLKLSASSNEHEAAAAAAKAHAMLAEHNLSMADVPGEDSMSSASTATTRTRKGLERWAFNLAAYTAESFDCGYYHSSSGHTMFVGVGADPEVCAWTFGYLYKALLRLASAYMRGKTRLRSNRSKAVARSSYLAGAVAVVGNRLLKQKQDAPVTSGALVPVKEEAVKAAMPEDVREKKFKGQQLRDEDVLAGVAAGHGIPLSTPMSGHAAEAIL